MSPRFTCMNTCSVPLGTKHVDTSWPVGVLEDPHVDRTHNFEYVCPQTPLLHSSDFSAFVQILQYINFYLYCTPAKCTLSTTAQSVLSLDLKGVTSVVGCVKCVPLHVEKKRMIHPHGKRKIARPTPYQGLKN